MATRYADEFFADILSEAKPPKAKGSAQHASTRYADTFFADMAKEQQEAQARKHALDNAVPPEAPGMINQGLKGLGAGLAQTAGSVGTGAQMLGNITGIDALENAGKTAYDYWDKTQEGLAPDESIQGSILKNPSLLANGSWWAYNIMQMTPSFAAAMIPGAAAYKTLKGGKVLAKVLGKEILLDSAKIERLAKLGASIVGGSVGGALEGSSTYQEVLKKGGSPTEAASAATAMAFASGGLNAVGLDKILRKAPKGAMDKFFHWIKTGAWEGGVEFLEEPVEAFIKWAHGYATPEEMWEQTYQGANVFPVAAVMGAGGSMLGGFDEDVPPGLETPDSNAPTKSPFPIDPRRSQVRESTGLPPIQQGVPGLNPTTPLNTSDVPVYHTLNQDTSQIDQQGIDDRMAGRNKKRMQDSSRYPSPFVADEDDMLYDPPPLETLPVPNYRNPRKGQDATTSAELEKQFLEAPTAAESNEIFTKLEAAIKREEDYIYTEEDGVIGDDSVTPIEKPQTLGFTPTHIDSRNRRKMEIKPVKDKELLDLDWNYIVTDRDGTRYIREIDPNVGLIKQSQEGQAAPTIRNVPPVRQEPSNMLGRKPGERPSVAKGSGILDDIQGSDKQGVGSGVRGDSGIDVPGRTVPDEGVSGEEVTPSAGVQQEAAGTGAISAEIESLPEGRIGKTSLRNSTSSLDKALQGETLSALIDNKEIDEKSAIDALTSITKMRKRMRNMKDTDPALLARIEDEVRRIEDAIKEAGYEIEDLVGNPYVDGLTVYAKRFHNSVVDGNTEVEEYISHVIKPQIMKDGRIISVADVEIDVRSLTEEQKASKARSKAQREKLKAEIAESRKKKAESRRKQAADKEAVTKSEAVETTKPSNKDQIDKPLTTINEKGQTVLELGYKGPIKPGNVFRTKSGRTTTPYPKQKSQKYISQWVIDNAVMEAESRGDEWNANIFKNTQIFKAGKRQDAGYVAQADSEGLNDYLFGEQPEVQKPFLKPLIQNKEPLSATKPAPKPQGKLYLTKSGDKPFKTKLSTTARRKGLAKEGIITEPIEVKDGWALEEISRTEPVTPAAWKQTRQEYAATHDGDELDKLDKHLEIITNRVNAGKEVPARVLKEYPKLRDITEAQELDTQEITDNTKTMGAKPLTPKEAEVVLRKHIIIENKGLGASDGTIEHWVKKAKNAYTFIKNNPWKYGSKNLIPESRKKVFDGYLRTAGLLDIMFDERGETFYAIKGADQNRELLTQKEADKRFGRAVWDEPPVISKDEGKPKATDIFTDEEKGMLNKKLVGFLPGLPSGTWMKGRINSRRNITNKQASDITGISIEKLRKYQDIKQAEMEKAHGGTTTPKSKNAYELATEEMEQIEADIASFIEKNGEEPIQADIKPINGKKRIVRVHRSTKVPGSWQFTIFDDKGPSSDSTYKSYSEMLYTLIMDYGMDLSKARTRKPKVAAKQAKKAPTEKPAGKEPLAPWEMSREEFYEAPREGKYLEILRNSQKYRNLENVPENQLAEKLFEERRVMEKNLLENGFSEWDIENDRLPSKKSKKRLALWAKYKEKDREWSNAHREAMRPVQNEVHRAVVEYAISEGKDVPAKVLAEYPGLAKRPAGKAAPDEKPKVEPVPKQETIDNAKEAPVKKASDKEISRRTPNTQQEGIARNSSGKTDKGITPKFSTKTKTSLSVEKTDEGYVVMRDGKQVFPDIVGMTYDSRSKAEEDMNEYRISLEKSGEIVSIEDEKVIYTKKSFNEKYGGTYTGIDVNDASKEELQMIGDALDAMIRKFPKLARIIQQEKMTINVTDKFEDTHRQGQYDTGNRTVSLMRGTRKTVPKDFLHPSKWRSNTSGDFLGTLRHELGHYYGLSLLHKEANSKIRDFYKSLGRGRISKEISSYATTNENEMFAEMFSAYSAPWYGGNNRFARDIEVFLEDILRVKGWNQLSTKTKASGQGSTVATVERNIKSIKEKYGVKTKVVQSASELPSQYQEYINTIKGRTIRGLYDPSTDTVYLVADGITNRAEALEVVLHETVGHKGLMAVVGKDYNAYMDWVADGKYKSEIDELQGKLKLSSRRLATEEWFARQTESGNIDQSLWNRFRAMINRVLRRMGFNITFADADLKELVRRSNEAALANGAAVKAGGVVASTQEPRPEWYSQMAQVMDKKLPGKATKIDKHVGVVNGFDVTPDMKQAALMGAPMFSTKKKPNVNKPGQQARLSSKEIPATNPDNVILTNEKWTRKLQRNVQDFFYRVKAVQDLVGGVTDEKDVYGEGLLMPGKIGDRTDRFNDVVIQKKNSLLNRMADDGITIADMDFYLVAKGRQGYIDRVLSNNPDYDPNTFTLSESEASAIIETYEAEDKPYTKYAEEIYGISKKNLKNRLDAQLIDQKMYDDLIASDPYYVPFKGTSRTKVANYGNVGKGISSTRKEFHKAKGRTSIPDSPIAQVIIDQIEGIVRSEHNLVSNMLLDFVKDQGKNIKTESGKPVFEVKKQQYIPKYNKDGEIEYLDPIITRAEKEGIVVIVKRNEPWTDTETKETRDKNFTYLITINDMPLAESVKRLGASKAIPILSAANQYLRNVNIMLNPEFIFTNFTKDIQEAMVHISGEQSGKMALQVAKDVPAAMKGIWRDIRDKKPNEYSKWYKEFAAMGGTTGFFTLQTNEEKFKSIERQVRRFNKNGKNIGAAFVGLGRYVSDINKVVELGVRVSAYRRMVESGVSKKKAALYAKGMTVNFNLKGNWGTVINSLYLFATAGIQGSTRIFTAMKNPTVRKIVGGTIAFAFMLNMFNRWADEDEWDKVSDYNKDHYWMFMTPYGKAITVKLPYGYNVPVVMGGVAADVVSGDTSMVEGMTRILNAVNDAFNPFGGGSFAQTLAPTVADPLIQIAENKNFFGGPIYREQPQFGPKKPGSQLYYRGVSAPAKAVTEWIHKVTGGTDRLQGSIAGVSAEVNPEIIDHIATNLTGGLGKFMLNTLGVATSVTKGELPRLDKVPFVRHAIKGGSEWKLLSDIREIVSESGRRLYTDAQHEELYRMIIAAVEDGDMDPAYAKRTWSQYKNNQKKAIYSKEKAKKG